VGLTLTVRHGLLINIHRGLNARVAHQLLSLSKPYPRCWTARPRIC
jgi:hypothetical protein